MRTHAIGRVRGFVSAVAVFGCASSVAAQMPDPPGQVKGDQRPRHEAYLFAHMMDGDYWRLHYSVSLDGLHWERLNGGKRVFDAYRGHADICRGHDGRYYLVGNRGDDRPDINFWVSDDLIAWKRYSDYVPDLRKVPDYARAMPRIGAPKLFFDEVGAEYLLTWHTPHDMGQTELPEPYWASQRTLWVTSKDLKVFSDPPRKLFSWDMATIDTIVRREAGRYYAIFKDERYPTLEWTTGKTIRICCSPSLLGPYSAPGLPVSPGFREAPTLIPSPDGKAWYLYYEQYPGVAYGLSVGGRLEGPWFQAAGGTRHRDWNKYVIPPGVRHGSMMPITRKQYDALVVAFGKGERGAGGVR
ncbi:MAG: glycosyl hydrolase family 43 [Phycisphaerae bacterium]|nr:glycosyl hydrolase family 43 [Phycisphaerae bacterium]